ncbi:hypothetical protein Vadar_005528 [Vaccinium darrowii]|uniref:Uncharacterized protein n=1 Tax=Vaccinium darrowii TaxID=229202 RepID=A0ACB7WY71_9ERIC|nr:hypothetical protein Vadar_005528 [Vaccinium darrowii]
MCTASINLNSGTNSFITISQPPQSTTTIHSPAANSPVNPNYGDVIPTRRTPPLVKIRALLVYRIRKITVRQLRLNPMNFHKQIRSQFPLMDLRSTLLKFRVMDRTRRNLRSSNRGRGRATPTTHGRGHTIPMGCDRGSETPADHEDIVHPEITLDPIVEAVANSVPPTTPIDPTAAYQAIQTLVGLFTGQQAQTGPANATNSMTFDKGTVLDRFLKTTPPSFIGYVEKQVEKEEDKVWYFLKGLRSDIHGRVSLLDIKTLAELVTKALTAENDIKEENMSKEHQSKRNREWWQTGQKSEGGNINKKIFNEGNQGQRLCDRCGKSHFGYSCDGTPKLCYSCGQPGHIASRCRGKGKDVDPS